jgi:mannose-6-phosphate isomerase-like protein (cupin superfamily)
MEIISLHQAPKVPSGLDGKILFSGEKSEIIHLTLQPGEELPMHVNPLNVIFYGLEGEAALNFKDHSLSFGKDNCIMIPEGVERGWTNTGDSIFRILVIKLKN